jgi:DNA-directed RNA polymerase sigma subunit (sigma70/sigma32)
MKIAIFGKLKQATSYHDWYTCFRRQLREVPISEILITGGNTVLNRYVKHYAKSLAISVKEYHLDESTDLMQAKLYRNKRIVLDADLVAACVDEQMYAEKGDVEIVPSESTTGAIIINCKRRMNTIKTIRNIKEKKDIKREELITLEEEIALIKQIRQLPDNCEAEKQKLLLANSRFVRVIADRYANEKHQVEELVVEGNKGLLHAVIKYDETKGYKFISYAHYWIKEYIKEYLKNNSN